MLVETIIKKTLGLKSHRVVRVEEGSGGVLRAQIVPRRRSRAICSGCGQRRQGYDRLPQRRYRHLAFWGIQVELLYRPRRVNCPRCGIKVEQVPWAMGKSHLTTPLVVVIATFARLLSWQEVSRLFGVSWGTVRQAVAQAVSYGLEHREVTGVISIGIDEISRQRGHRYMTNVYDFTGRRLIWTGVGRDENTLRRFFAWWGKERSEALVAVCCDMWRPYMNVIEESAPNAVIVFDKFHVVRHLMDAVDKVRKEEARLLAEAGIEDLKGTKYLWLKNPWRWTKKQKSRFRELMRSNLKIYRAYLIKEAFRTIWKYKTVGWAKRYLKRWFWWATHSRLEPIREFAWLLRRHEQGILNAIKFNINNAFVEGMNRKAKVISQRAYGFRKPDTYALALYHGLGKLPMPETTHKFL